jgi:hypothetical protein
VPPATPRAPGPAATPPSHSGEDALLDLGQLVANAVHRPAPSQPQSGKANP